MLLFVWEGYVPKNTIPVTMKNPLNPVQADYWTEKQQDYLPFISNFPLAHITMWSTGALMGQCLRGVLAPTGPPDVSDELAGGRPPSFPSL